MAGGSLGDAARIIRYRQHFPDLDVALAFVGTRLAGPLSPDVPAGTAGPAFTWPDSWTGVTVDPIDSVVDAADNIGELDSDLVREIELSHIQTIDLPQQAGLEGSLDDPAGFSSEVGDDAISGRGLSGAPSPLLLGRRRRERVLCSMLRVESTVRPDPPAYRSVASPRPSTMDTPPRLIPETTLIAGLDEVVRVPRPGPRLDLPLLIRWMEVGEPIRATAFEPMRSTPPELRLLIDHRLRIGPLAEDTRHVSAAARDLVGASNVEEWGVTPGPGLACGSGPVWTWRSLSDQSSCASTLLVTGGSGVLTDDGAPWLSNAVTTIQRRGGTVGLLLFAPTIRPGLSDAVATWTIDG